MSLVRSFLLVAVVALAVGVVCADAQWCLDENGNAIDWSDESDSETSGKGGRRTQNRCSSRDGHVRASSLCAY